MASLLSLRPSRSIEESQHITRTKLLNSPALSSSKIILTSFKGRKKDESLSKSVPLTRNSLGITIKRNKVDESDNKNNNEDFSKEHCYEKNEETGETEKDHVKDMESKEAEKDNTKDKNIIGVSLVGDYSSSGESD